MSQGGNNFWAQMLQQHRAAPPEQQAAQRAAFWGAVSQNQAPQQAPNQQAAPVPPQANPFLAQLFQAAAAPPSSSSNSAVPVQAPSSALADGGILGQVIQGIAGHVIRTIAQQAPAQKERPRFDVRLSREQIAFFATNGFLRIENIIQPRLISRALAAINSRLGKGIPESEAEKFNIVRGGLGYWPDLAHTDVIMDLLYQSPLYAYVDALVGPTHPCEGGQIALRFPGVGCFTRDGQGLPEALKPHVTGFVNLAEKFGVDLEQHLQRQGRLEANPHETEYLIPTLWRPQWHIDGIPNARNGLPANFVMQFTILVGVLLSDVPSEFCGNLSVFPGSHEAVASYLRTNGVNPANLLSTSSNEEASGPADLRFPHPSVQMTGKAGDVFLCHYQLAHSISPNASPNVRYCVYFRLHHHTRQRGQFRPEAMLNPWLEFDSVRTL